MKKLRDMVYLDEDGSYKLVDALTEDLQKTVDKLDCNKIDLKKMLMEFGLSEAEAEEIEQMCMLRLKEAKDEIQCKIDNMVCNMSVVNEGSIIYTGDFHEMNATLTPQQKEFFKRNMDAKL